MRSIRFAVFSVLALAAASSQAIGVATAFSLSTFTYTADAGLSLASPVMGEEYDFAYHGTSFYNPAGTASAAQSAVSSHSVLSGVYTTSATTTATLDAPGTAYVDSTKGWQWNFAFTNSTSSDLTVSFDIQQQRSMYFSSDSPLGDFNSSGYYAECDAYGGVANIDTGEIYYNTDFIDSTDAGSATDLLQTHPLLAKSITILANSTQTVGVWASSESFLSHGVVTPEPASMIALGVGALGLLRRRRKA